MYKRELAPGTGKNNELLNTLMPLVVNGVPARRITERTTPDELWGHFVNYLETCKENDICPGMESLACYLGVSRRAIDYWASGEKRKELTAVAQSIKQFMKMYMEQAFQKNKIPSINGIFLMKNWYGYKDTTQTEIEVKPSPFGQTIPNEQIEAMIED